MSLVQMRPPHPMQRLMWACCGYPPPSPCHASQSSQLLSKLEPQLTASLGRKYTSMKEKSQDQPKAEFGPKNQKEKKKTTMKETLKKVWLKWQNQILILEGKIKEFYNLCTHNGQILQYFRHSWAVLINMSPCFNKHSFRLKRTSKTQCGRTATTHSPERFYMFRM